MSRSYRSQKESVIAKRRIARAADGTPVLPRIIERAPAAGDTHPISKRLLRRLLSLVPVEFLYGLDRIELRARQVDTPYGCYLVRERAIILYSLPPVLSCLSLRSDFGRSLVRFGAKTEPQSEGFSVTWPSPAHLGHWFYSYVVAHELGHHFVEQYKTKNSRIHSRNAEELVADLHAQRITDQLLAFYREQKKKVQESCSPRGLRANGR